MNGRAAIPCLLCAAALALAGCGTPPVRRAEETQRFRGYLSERGQQLAIDPSLPLSQARCEELAVAGSLDLRVRTLALGLQDDRIRLALTTGTPRATAQYFNTERSNASLARTGGLVTEVEDRHQQRLAIDGIMPVLDWGLTYYGWQIALDRKGQEEFLLARAEQLLRRDVRIAYARHAGAIRQERLAAIAYAAAEQVLRVARSLEEAKLTVHADTALIESALAESGLQLAVTRNRVERTHLDLSQLMSFPPDVQFRIDEALVPLPAVPDAPQLAQYEERALQVRPELGAQDLERRISASSVRKEAAAFFPRVDLTYGFNWTGSSFVVNPSWFLGGFQVGNALLDGGATIFQYSLARKTENLEKVRTLLVSLGVLYEVDLGALGVRVAHETVLAAGVLEKTRKAALDRVVSLYKEGLEDEAGAARALADLTIQSTALDQAQTDYIVAWHELEAAVLPQRSIFSPLPAQSDSQPTSQPATQPASQASQRLSQAATQPASQSATHLSTQSATQPASQPTSRSAGQEGSQP